MKKLLKKIGDSVGIIFNKEEQKVYNLNEGEVINIEIIKEEKKDG